MTCENLLGLSTPTHDPFLAKEYQPVPFPQKTTPSSSTRYRRKKCHRPAPQTFGPETVRNRGSETQVIGWSTYIHPEGLVYYCDFSRQIVTDANLTDSRTFELVESSIQLFLDWLKVLDFKIRDVDEIIIELSETEDCCMYYMVDHALQTVFYPEKSNTDELGLRDLVSTVQLKSELCRQFWISVEYFPMHRELPPTVKIELLGILYHATFDGLSSSNSTSAISPGESQQYLQIIQNLTGAPETSGYETCIMARIMEDLQRGRVLHFYGEPSGARLARREYVADGLEPDSPSFWFVPVSFLLFGFPNKKLQMIDSMGVNGIFYKDSWREFNASQVSEWKQVTAMSFVLMIVDIMSITHLQNSQIEQRVISNIATQIGWNAGAMAALSCCGAVILALSAINVHQPYCKTDASKAAAYFERSYSGYYGYQPLAIVLGLPYAMFFWALAGTGVTFILLVLRTEQTWSMGLLSGIVLFMAGLICWALRALHSGERREEGFFISLFTSIRGALDAGDLV